MTRVTALREPLEDHHCVLSRTTPTEDRFGRRCRLPCKHRGGSTMRKNQVFTVILTLLLLPEAGFAQVVYDDFNHPRWKIVTDGSGPESEETNRRLEIVLPADSRGTTSDVFGVSYDSVCRLRGDFDIRVSYALLEFPALNGVRVGLGVHEPGQFSQVVERTSFSQHDALPPGEVYLTDFGGVIEVPTTDTSGRLRLVRKGKTLTGYYFDAISGDWQSISSVTYTANEVHFAIAAWSHDLFFDDKRVRVAFDQVVIRRGVLLGACLPRSQEQE